MTANTQLASLTVAALVALHNTAVEDYNPSGFEAVTGFKSKSKAIEAIETMLESGNLAVMFDGDSAVIVDATPTPPVDRVAAFKSSPLTFYGIDDESEVDIRQLVADDATLTDAERGEMLAHIDADNGGEYEQDSDVGGDDEQTGDDESGDDESGDDESAEYVAFGDGKGERAKSGFLRASDEWLKATPRGSEAREAYRKARRKAARMTRKAARAAKEAALDAAMAQGE